MASVIQQETQRLSRLVDNLLDLSRLEAGAAEPRREWVSVDELIRASVAEVGAPPEDFSLSIDPDLPFVRLDAVQMERAFVNVMENARRHSGGHPVIGAGPGGAEPRIGAPQPRPTRTEARRRRARARGDRVIVRIVDRGPGIPPAQLERVFQPFYRAGTPGRRAPRLGARARDRARLHGVQRRDAARRVAARAGRDVRVRTAARRRRRRGSGATVRGRGERRRRRAGAGPRNPSRTGERAGADAAPRPRILVVDDEPQIVRALKVVLREAGFDASAAETSAEALDAAAVRPPEAAIIDLVLPDGDGIELTRRLREWSEMPILVLSAVGEESQKVRALEAGADDYVTKPFGTRELIARLQAALRRAGRGEEEPTIAVDGLEIDLAARVVRRDGEPVHLTPIEFDLLRALARNRGRLMTHRKLLVDVWGPEYVDDIQPLRTHIARLRAKIEPERARGGRCGRALSTSSPSRASATASRTETPAAAPAACTGPVGRSPRTP